MRHLLRRLWYVMRQRRLEADLAEEMEFHRVMKQRELESRCGDSTEAAFAARRAFGSAALARDRARDVWIAIWLQDILQDLKFTLRLLGKDRGFTLVATMVLGLGIGVDNTLLIAVNAACFRGLPIERPDRVVFVAARDAHDREVGLSYRDFEETRSAMHAFAGLAAYTSLPMAVGDEGRAPDRAFGTYLSANAFRQLGEPPLLGRDFAAEDDRSGAPAVVILGNGLWKTRYAGDPSVVGRTIRVNGAPAIVVGVMREGFKFPGFTQLWQPLMVMPRLATDRRTARTLSVFGRIADGSTMAEARDQLAGIAQRLSRDYSETNQGIRITAVPINDKYTNKITDPQWASLLIVGAVVVLIACANVANLLLMRAAHRSHEIAIRASLGASRGRLVRQLLLESTALATLGGTLGAALSVVGGRLLTSLVPESDMPFWIRFTMDGRVFAVLCLLCLGTVFVFGLAPAIHVSKTDVNHIMKDGGRTGTGGVRARWWTTAFLTAEFALTTVLLAWLVTGARLGRAAERADLVFDASNVVTTSITLPPDRYRSPDARVDFYRRLQERLSAVPSISFSAVASALPLGGAAARQLAIDGRPASRGDMPPTVWSLIVGARYFETIGAQIVRGRPFSDRDGAAGAESAIVNQRFAEMYFPNDDPIGHRIRLTDANASSAPAPWTTIVGVSPIVRQRPLPHPDPIVYLPLGAAPPATFVLMARARPAERRSTLSWSPLAATVPVLRETVRAIDPDLPLYRLMPMEQALAESQWAARGSNRITWVVVGVALILAAVGLYTVTAHAVIQRTPEIGIRMVLGARSPDVVWMVMRQASVQLGLGLLAGIGCAVGWERIFRPTNEFERIADPVTLAAVAALLASIAVIACLSPTRRATRVDPIVALRYE